MPDIQSNPYNYNTELQDTGVVTPPPATDGGPGPKAAPKMPDLFATMDAVVKKSAANPLIKAAAYTTPVNTRLDQTTRYDDPKYGFSAFNPNIETQYGDRESWYKSFGKSVLRTGTNVLGGFVQTIATIPNVINAAVSKDFSKIYDNPINNEVSDVMKSIDEALPTYKTTWEENHPILNYIPFKGNGWSKVMENIGFVAGAIGGSVVQDAAVGALTGGVGTAPLIAAQLTGLASKLGRIFAGGEEALSALTKAAATAKNIETTVNVASPLAKIASKSRYALALQTGAWSQAAMMANNTHEATLQELKQDFYDKNNYEATGADLEKINRYSHEAANADLLGTAVMLSVVDAIQFPTILKPFNAAKRSLETTLESGESAIFNKATKQYEVSPQATKGIKGISNKLLPSARLLTSTITETGKMGAQVGFQRSAQDFYKRKFDNESMSDSQNLIESLGTGLKQVLFTPEGRESALMGGLIGIGMHGIRLAAEKFRGVTASKGEITNRILNLMNQHTAFGTLKDHIEEATTQVSIQRDMKRAVETGNVFEYKNLQHQSLFESVHSAVKANKFDARMGEWDMMKDLTPEEFKTQFGMDFSDGTKQTVAEYIDAVKRKAHEIKKTIDKVNSAFTNPYKEDSKKPDEYRKHVAYEEAKKQMALDLSEVKDNRERTVKLKTELTDALPNVDAEKVMDLTSEEGVKRTIKDFSDRIGDLNKDDELLKGSPADRAKAVKERQFLEEKVNALQSHLDNPNPEKYIGEIKDIVNYYKNGDVSGKDPVDLIDLLSGYNKGEDLYKLDANARAAAQHFEALTNPSRMEEFMKERMDLAEKVAAILAVDKDGNPLSQTENPAGTEEVIRDAYGNVVTKPKETAPSNLTSEEAADLAALNAKVANAPAPAEAAETKGTATAATPPASPLTPEESLRLQQLQAKQKAFEEAQVAPTTATTASTDQVAKDGTIISGDAGTLPQDAEPAVAGSKPKVSPNVAKKLVTRQPIFKVTDPITFLHNIFSTNRQDGVKELDNLKEALFFRPFDKLVKDITLTIKKNTESPTKFVAHPNKELTNFRRKTTSPINAELVVDGKVIGRLQDPDSLYHIANGKEEPLSEVSREDYVKATGNDIKTYDQFMKVIKDYKAMYDKIVGDGSEKTLSYAELSKVIEFLPNYGSRDQKASADEATLLKHLKYKGTGDIVLSFPFKYDPETGQFGRVSKPYALGIDSLDPNSEGALQDFLGTPGIIDKMHQIDSRYVLVQEMPDGKYKPLSVIAARPVQASKEILDETFNLIKNHAPDASDESLRYLNEKLRNDLYIADITSPKGTGNILFLQANKDGSVSLVVMRARGRGENAEQGVVTLSNAKIKELTSFQNVVDALNKEIGATSVKGESLYPKLNGLVLSRESFKTNIPNDSDPTLTTENLGDKLTVAAAPFPYQRFSLQIHPEGTHIEEPHPTRDPKEVFTAQPPAEKVLNPNTIASAIRVTYTKEYGKSGRPLLDSELRQLATFPPVFTADGKLDPTFLRDSLNKVLGKEAERVTTAGATTLSNIIGNVRDNGKFKSRRRGENLTPSQHKALDTIELNEYVPEEIKAKAQENPAEAIKDLEKVLDKPVEQPKVQEQPKATVIPIKESAPVEAPEAKSKETVKLASGTEFVYQQSSTKAEDGTFPMKWQFKDSRGKWSNAGTKELAEIEALRAPKTEEPVTAAPVVETPTITLKEALGTETVAAIETAAKVPTPAPQKSVADRAIEARDRRRAEESKKLLDEINAKDKWLKPIPTDTGSFYGHLSEIQQAVLNHKYDAPLREGKITEEQLREVLRSTERHDPVNPEEKVNNALYHPIDEPSMEQHFDLIKYRADHPELENNASRWTKIPQERTGLPWKAYLSDISGAIAKGKDSLMYKAIEKEALSPEDAIKVLEETGHWSKTAKPKAISELIAQKLKEGKETKSQIKEAAQVAKEEAIAVLTPETVIEKAREDNQLGPYANLSDEQALKEIAKQAQNVQEDGSISTLATEEQAKAQTVRALKGNEILVDLAIKEHPKESLLTSKTEGIDTILPKLQTNETSTEKAPTEETTPKSEESSRTTTEDSQRSIPESNTGTEGLEPTEATKAISERRVAPVQRVVKEAAPAVRPLKVTDVKTQKSVDDPNVTELTYKGEVIGRMHFDNDLHQWQNSDYVGKEAYDLDEIGENKVAAMEELVRRYNTKNKAALKAAAPKAEISNKLATRVKGLVESADSQDVFEKQTMTLENAAAKAQRMLDENEQGIKENLPDEYKALKDIIKKAEQIDETVETPTEEAGPKEIKVGDKVQYQGESRIVNDVQQSDKGNNWYYLDGIPTPVREDDLAPAVAEKSPEMQAFEASSDPKVIDTLQEMGDIATPEEIQSAKDEEERAKLAGEHDNLLITYTGLKGILERLKNKFGVDYKVVENNHFPDAVKGWRGRFKDGKVYINISNFNKDTAFHEYLHPFIEAIKTDNQELYNKLHDLLAQDPEGQAELKIAQRFYANDTPEEQRDEALVTYMAKKMADMHTPEGQRKRTTFWEAAKDLMTKFKVWLNDVLWNSTRTQGQNATITVKDFSESGTIKTKGTKGQKVETTDQNFIDTMTLDDFVKFVGMTDVKFDLGNTIEVIKRLDRFQKDPTNTKFENEILNRLKRNLPIFTDVAERRAGSAELSVHARELKEILTEAEKDEGLSVTNYIAQGVRGISYANDEMSRIKKTIEAGNLNANQVTQLQARLGVVKRFYEMYKDVDTNWERIVGRKLDDDVHREQMQVLNRARTNITTIKRTSADLLTEWLYPSLEASFVLNKDKSGMLTKEEFRSKLFNADGEPDKLLSLLGSIGSSKDPVNAVVKTALLNVFKKNHEESQALNADLQEEYHNFLKRTGLTNDRKTTTEWYKNNYLRKAVHFEKIDEDKDGKPIYGYKERLAFHEEYYHDKFFQDRQAFIEKLGEMPDHSDKKAYQEYADKLFAWEQENTVERKTGKMLDVIDNDEHSPTFKEVIRREEEKERVPIEKYRNHEFTKLQADPFYKKLYESYKKSNDSYGEFGLKHGIIPQISKGKEKFSDERWNQGLKGKAQVIGSKVKEFIAPKGKDNVVTVTGEDGKEYNFGVDDINLDGSIYRKVKHPYTRMLEEDDLDAVLIESVLKYHHSAAVYHDVTDAQPNIEALQEMIKGSGHNAETTLGLTGRTANLRTTVGNDVIFGKKLGRPQAELAERLNKQLDSFINDVVYGDSELKANLNILGRNVSLNKLGKNVGFLTALNNMAFNVGGGIANSTIGNVMSLGEAVGGKYYNKNDWWQAHREYWGEALNGNLLGDVTGIKKSPLTQLAIMYDAIQGEFRDKWGKNIVGSLAQRYANGDTLFMINHAAEHEIQMKFMLAMMRGQKVDIMKNGVKTGEQISLRDAYVPDARGYLKLRPDVEWTDAQKDAFTRRLHAKNYELNGNYSDFDKAQISRTWYGKMVLIYRKYMYNAFRARFGQNRYDYELGDSTEGTYRTFVSKLVSDIRQYKWDAARRLLTRDGWTADQKVAFNKTVYELSLLAGTFTLGLAIQTSAQKKDASWLEREAYLRLLNLNSDLGQFSIAGVGDMVRIMQNPSVAMNTLGKYANFFSQLVTDPTEEYKRRTGVFDKGSSKLMASFLKAAPIARQVVNILQPEEQAKFFQMTSGHK